MNTSTEIRWKITHNGDEIGDGAIDYAGVFETMKGDEARFDKLIKSLVVGAFARKLCEMGGDDRMMGLKLCEFLSNSPDFDKGVLPKGVDVIFDF